MGIVTDEILAEYILMRGNDRDINEVLDTLRPYIKTLSKATKQELARSIRAWEKQKESAELESDSPSKIKPLKSVAKAENREIEEADWLTCPHCGKKNRTKEGFCYACGLMLDISVQTGTRHFTDRLTPNNQYFGAESVLVLKVHNTEHEFEVRPQVSNQGIFIGRCAANSTMTPDVDLSEADAERQGVSRLHMEIKYDPETEAIQISDLGSVNGSFVNGQKLHPKEIKVLNNGDEIKLGRLIMRVDFHHPGDEI